MNTAEDNNQSQGTATGEPAAATTSAQPAAFSPELHAAAARAYFESQGLVVKTRDEIQSEVDSAVKKAHTDWENSLVATLGMQKPDGVKGLDWAKKAIQDKIATSSTSNGSNDSEKDAIITTLKKQMDDLKKQVDEEVKKAQEVKARTEFEGALKVIRFSDDKEENATAMQDAADMLRGRYKFKYSEEHGRTIALDRSGKPIIDPDSVAPITIDKLVERDAKRFMKAPAVHKPQGTGSVPPVAKNKDGIPILTSKDAIFTEASSKHEKGSKEWLKYIRDLAEAAGIEL